MIYVGFIRTGYGKLQIYNTFSLFKFSIHHSYRNSVLKNISGTLYEVFCYLGIDFIYRHLNIIDNNVAISLALTLNTGVTSLTKQATS
jgi:hypothetical protein